MKKKLIVMLMALSVIGMVFGCGNKNDDPASDNQGTQQETDQVLAKDSLEVLTKVWDNFYGEDVPEEERMKIMGGGYSNSVMDAPGEIDLADTDSLTALLSFPAESVDMIDNAASMMHAMNANTFTAAAYHVTDAANQQTLITNLEESIKNTQWMCGFPEVLVIATVGDDYVVTAIGAADIVDTLKAQLTEQYSAKFVVDESLM